MKLNSLLLICMIFISLVSSSSVQQCKNSAGESVDWWVIFKMPYDASINPKGMTYFYCDSSQNCQDLVQQNLPLDDVASSALFHTLKQVDSSNANQAFVTWNDQAYNKTTISNYAHSKGILTLNSQQGIGFIINHSLPRFPMVDQQGNIIQAFDDNASVNGQQFFCITVSANTLEAMAQLYIVAEIRTSNSNFPDSLKTSYPNLYQLKDNVRKSSNQKIVVNNLHQAINVSTVGDLKIQMIAKSQNFQYDFYDAVVIPILKVNMFIETWGNGAGGLSKPNCQTDYKVQSNTQIKMKDFMTYSYTKDHSKYGISQESTEAYVCMGDMNRQETQSKRGGTTLCFQNVKLWRLISNMFTMQQSCAA